MKWMPIETAPKDATHILAYADGAITTVYWFDLGSSWELVKCGAGAYEGEFEPTHWMQLPEPPQDFSGDIGHE